MLYIRINQALLLISNCQEALEIFDLLKKKEQRKKEKFSSYEMHSLELLILGYSLRA